jgi:hypothetical protein
VRDIPGQGAAHIAGVDRIPASLLGLCRLFPLQLSRSYVVCLKVLCGMSAVLW